MRATIPTSPANITEPTEPRPKRQSPHSRRDKSCFLQAREIPRRQVRCLLLRLPKRKASLGSPAKPSPKYESPEKHALKVAAVAPRRAGLQEGAKKRG